MIHIAGGCSYTDKNYTSHLLVKTKITQPVMWPELLSKKINFKTVNLAESGASHDEIFQKVFFESLKKPANLITLGLTEWTRIYVPSFGTFNPVFQYDIANFINNNCFSDEFEKIGYQKIYQRYEVLQKLGLENFALKAKEFICTDNFIEKIVNDLHQKLFLFVEHCNARQINFLVVQLVDPYPLWFTDKNALNVLEKKVINSPYFTYLNNYKKQLIGWPFLPSLDGWNYDYEREQTDKNKFTWTHEQDRHPNQLGQNQIADILFREYNNVYKN